MTPHSSILAWKIPWTEEPGGLWSMGSHRVRHDWRDWANTYAYIYTVHSVAQLSLTLWLHEPWPSRLLCPWNFPGKDTGVGCYFLLHMLLLSCVQLFVTPWTAALQASQSLTISQSFPNFMNWWCYPTISISIYCIL